MTSNHYCSVPHCRSWAKKDPERKLSFHHFPKPNSGRVYLETKTGIQLVDRRKAWIMRLCIGKPITKYMKVCSLHFQKEDYFHKGELSRANSRELKKIAVPSQNLPTSTLLSNLSTQTQSSLSQGYERRQGLSETRRNSFTKTYPNSLCTGTDEEDEGNHSEAEIQAANGLINLRNSKKKMY